MRIFRFQGKGMNKTMYEEGESCSLNMTHPWSNRDSSKKDLYDQAFDLSQNLICFYMWFLTQDHFKCNLCFKNLHFFLFFFFF